MVSGDQRRDDGDESTQLGGREREHGMGALDGEAGGRGCALGVGMQRHQRGDEVETVAHVQGGSEEVSSACPRRSADHMVTWMRTPCRAYQHGEELSLAGMHRVGSCPTGGCMETSWQATLLGRGPGERGGALRGLGRRSGGGWDGDAPPLPTGSRCATQLDRPDRMARQGIRLRLRVGMKVVMWARVRTHTHTRTHTHAWGWGGCWIVSRRVGRGCGRRLGMGRGFVFARRFNRCVRGLPRGGAVLYLSLFYPVLVCTYCWP